MAWCNSCQHHVDLDLAPLARRLGPELGALVAEAEIREVQENRAERGILGTAAVVGPAAAGSTARPNWPNCAFRSRQIRRSLSQAASGGSTTRA